MSAWLLILAAIWLLSLLLVWSALRIAGRADNRPRVEVDEAEVKENTKPKGNVTVL
jgi:hypothetical protein